MQYINFIPEYLKYLGHIQQNIVWPYFNKAFYCEEGLILHTAGYLKNGCLKGFITSKMGATVRKATAILKLISKTGVSKKSWSSNYKPIKPGLWWLK